MMKRQSVVRFLASGLAALLLVAATACTSDAPQTAPSKTAAGQDSGDSLPVSGPTPAPTPPQSSPPTTARPGATFVPDPAWASVPTVGSITLQSCRWIEFGELEVAVSAGAQSEVAASGVEVSILHAGDIGIGNATGLIEVNGSGVFTVAFEIPDVEPEGDVVRVGRSDAYVPVAGHRCTLQNGVRDREQIASIGADLGTATRVGEFEFPTGHGGIVRDRLVPLERLLRSDRSPLQADEILVSDTYPLASVTLDSRSGCVVIAQRYNVGEDIENRTPQIELTQTWCDTNASPTEVITELIVGGGASLTEFEATMIPLQRSPH